MDPKNVKNAFALVNRLKKDRWRNPEQKMTGTQRVRAALGERFEQATLGQMGMLGRGIMAARRGEKAPFRRMLTSEIQRRIENTGPIGQALVAHAQAKRYQQMMEKQQLVNQTIAKQTAVIEQQQQHAEKQQQVVSNNITIVGKALYQIDQRLEDIVLSQRNINHILNKNRYGANASKPANDNRFGVVAVNDNLSKDPRRNPKQQQKESSILSGLTSLISTAVSTGLAAVFARFGLPVAGRLGAGVIGRGATAALGRYLPPAAAATAGTALGTFGADIFGGIASGSPAIGIGTALGRGVSQAYKHGYTPGGLIKRWFGKKPTAGIGGYPAAKSQTETEQHMRLKDFERTEANKQNQPDNIIKVVASQEMLFETLSSAPITFKANKIIFDAPNIVFGNQQAPSTSTPQAVPQQAVPQQQSPSAPTVPEPPEVPGIPAIPGMPSGPRAPRAPLPYAVPQPGTTRRRSGPADRYTPALPDSVRPVVPDIKQPRTRAPFVPDQVTTPDAAVMAGQPAAMGTWNKRINIPYDGRPASVRYNNPGASWTSPRDDAYGVEGYGIIGGGNRIGKFPSPIHGLASNMDLFSRSKNYLGQSLERATYTWRGNRPGNVPNFTLSDGTVVNGRTIITPDLVRNPEFMHKVFKSYAQHEAGLRDTIKDYHIHEAFKMFSAGGVEGYNRLQQSSQMPQRSEPALPLLDDLNNGQPPKAPPSVFDSPEMPEIVKQNRTIDPSFSIPSNNIFKHFQRPQADISASVPEQAIQPEFPPELPKIGRPNQQPVEIIRPDLPQIVPNAFKQFPMIPQAIPSEPIIMGMPAPTQQGQPISATTQLNGNPSGPLSPIQPPAKTDVPITEVASCVPTDDDFNTADRGGCKPIVDKNSETVGNKPGTPQPQSDWQ